MDIKYVGDKFVAAFEDKQKFFDFLVDCLNLVMPEGQKLTLRYRKFVSELALYRYEGGTLATDEGKALFNERMSNIIVRTKREWSQKDYDRYLSYVVVRAWLFKDKAGEVLTPPILNPDESYDYDYIIETSLKTTALETA